MLINYLEKLHELTNIRTRISLLLSGILAFIAADFLTETPIPVIVAVIIGILIWIALFFLIKSKVDMLYIRMCNYEVDAEILFSQVCSFGIGFGGSKTETFYNEITVEYEYNGRVYRVFLKFFDYEDRKEGKKIKLKINKKCPRIIRYEEN